jgi:hypothetical protein
LFHIKKYNHKIFEQENCNDLPPKPTAIISIPVIRIAIDILAASSGTPKPVVCAITKPDTAILSNPTPMRKPLYQPEIFLI